MKVITQKLEVCTCQPEIFGAVDMETLTCPGDYPIIYEMVQPTNTPQATAFYFHGKLQSRLGYDVMIPVRGRLVLTEHSQIIDVDVWVSPTEKVPALFHVWLAADRFVGLCVAGSDLVARAFACKAMSERRMTL